MIRTWLLLVLLFSTGSSLALDQISTNLRGFSQLRAEFTQERQLSALPVALHSSGHLLLGRDEGIWWQQQQPFGMTLLLTDTLMLQQVEGEAAQPMTAAGDPRMQQFQRLLRDLLLVDLQALAQHFELTALPAADGDWALRLKPQAAPLNQLFLHFELMGGEVVKQLLMKDTDGDTTLIRFTGHQLSDEPMTEKERALFYP